MASAVAATSSGRRAAAMVSAPAEARPSAMALPRPEVPPMTTAHFPVRSKFTGCKRYTPRRELNHDIATMTYMSPFFPRSFSGFCNFGSSFGGFLVQEGRIDRIEQRAGRVRYVIPEHDPGQMVPKHILAFERHRVRVVVGDENPAASVVDVRDLGCGVPVADEAQPLVRRCGVQHIGRDVAVTGISSGNCLAGLEKPVIFRRDVAPLMSVERDP